eukprot:2180498-Rhodomonas_salina.3
MPAAGMCVRVFLQRDTCSPAQLTFEHVGYCQVDDGQRESEEAKFGGEVKYRALFETSCKNQSEIQLVEKIREVPSATSLRTRYTISGTSMAIWCSGCYAISGTGIAL